MVVKKSTPKKAPATPVAAKPRTLAPHEIVLSSNIQNAVGILSWSKFAGEADISELCDGLNEQAGKVQDGDMRPVEGMLYRQAKTLETMFTSLARNAASETGLKQYQAKMTFALKAQAQCRATLEALAEIKNPRPVQFVRQANMTTGAQQVVNNDYAGTPSHTGMTTGAGNIQSEPNKLLEAQHGNYLDTGAQGTAGRADQALEAVGAGYRA